MASITDVCGEKKEKKPERDGGSVSCTRKTSKPSKMFKILETQGLIVGKTLGSGSYATVKSAYDMNRKHKVAIKIINKKKAQDEYLTKFLPREVEAMQTFGKHYAMIHFYQIIETTSWHFFIMELCDSGDLLTEIKNRGYIEEDQAGQWFIHLYDGTKYMHSKGIVHRDIKCENLVLTKQNTLKITDFGFAKKITKTKSGTTVLSETYCGSYAYAPPEILKGTPYNAELADVWSMGVVLYTMLYGSLPFDDCDHKKLLKQVQSRIVFPAKPEVSKCCRILIVKILSRVTERVPLKHLKADGWFKTQLNVKTFIKNAKNVKEEEKEGELTQVKYMEEDADKDAETNKT
ncbi:Testis-specific serine/threonine-protein kinase 4 [Mactra antiquata]